MYISQVQLGLSPHVCICIERALDAVAQSSSVHIVGRVLGLVADSPVAESGGLVVL